MKIRVAKPAAMDGTGGKRERAAGAKGSCETRCTGHSDKPLKRKSCSAEASTILSLISIVQKQLIQSSIPGQPSPTGGARFAGAEKKQRLRPPNRLPPVFPEKFFIFLKPYKPV